METQAPNTKHRTGTSTASFKAHKNTDYLLKDAKNKILGLAGERLVIDFEKRYLVGQGRSDLAERVRHISQLEGDGARYDVLSFIPNGEYAYIEVKTTTGQADTPFFMSSIEVEFSKNHQIKYLLYRVYEYDKNTDTAKFFRIAGDIQKSLLFTPIEYRVSIIGQEPGF